MAQNTLPSLVAARLTRWNAAHPNHQIDLKAVNAVGQQEGYSGRIGDSGHAFGPFQLNNAGGVITGRFGGETPQQIQQWATSPQGIDYALGGIGNAAGGLQGPAAVRAIVSRFERPANIPGETARALAAYGTAAVPMGGAGAGAPPLAPAPAAATSAQPIGNSLPGLLAALGSADGDYGGFYAKLGQTLKARTLPYRPAVPGALPPIRTLPARPGTFKSGVPVEDLTSTGGLHQTEGLPGYPAHDYFAPAGSPTVAPVTGRVIRLSGHNPADGPIEGPHGPLGWSVYIQGSDGHTYYLTHMGSRDVRVGETVKAGQPIGTVANYAKYGTPSHIHMGVH